MHLRLHGTLPFHNVFVHGGPGAAGEMGPVARAVSSRCGSLEPFQTAATLDGQIEELAGDLSAFADPPITLIGYSWGAWLAALTAARCPELVDKLVLISSGPFEQKYVPLMAQIRQARFTAEEWAEIEQIQARLADENAIDRPALFARFGALYGKADAYDPLPDGHQESASLNPKIYHSVWNEAAGLRQTGQLLQQVRQIFCPVVAIHGDYDPHPAEGVREPLSAALPDFRFILLERCGHTPWKERHAKESFYRVLLEELGTV